MQNLIRRILIALGIIKPRKAPPPTVAANPPPTDPPRSGE